MHSFVVLRHLYISKYLDLRCSQYFAGFYQSEIVLRLPGAKLYRKTRLFNAIMPYPPSQVSSTSTLANGHVQARSEPYKYQKSNELPDRKNLDSLDSPNSKLPTLRSRVHPTRWAKNSMSGISKAFKRSTSHRKQNGANLSPYVPSQPASEKHTFRLWEGGEGGEWVSYPSVLTTQPTPDAEERRYLQRVEWRVGRDLDRRRRRKCQPGIPGWMCGVIIVSLPVLCVIALGVVVKESAQEEWRKRKRRKMGWESGHEREERIMRETRLSKQQID